MKATRLLQRICAATLLLSLPALAENPILGYHYLADPAAASVGDSVFYIIGDTDYDNGPVNNVWGYRMKAAYMLSSKDMKNWTDHGEIFRVYDDNQTHANDVVPWAGGVWAPAVVWNNNKMWVYFPDGGGGGVGVVNSSNPRGPYKDPLKKPIVNGWGAGLIGCDGVSWCFDPGIFVDDDGQTYLTWGGGDNTNRPFGNNLNMVKLQSDGFTPTGTITHMDVTDKSMEASYITKRNGIYYLSYSTDDLRIAYSTSSSLNGPWASKGTVLANPNINGANINAYNNNHHGFAEFKGKWYAAYHDRRMSNALKDGGDAAFQRSISIDLLEYNGDNFKPLVFTNEGPAQVGTFNPYDTILAATQSAHKNITTRTVLVTDAPNINLLIPKPSKSGGSWIRVSGVNFGSGALTFKVNAANTNANNKVEIRTGSNTGTLAGTCTLANTGSWASFSNTECDVTGLTGVVDQLFLVFTGSDSTAGLKWWSFSSTPPVPQGPYKGGKATIPGTIEAENYDVGGEGVAFHDADGVNSGAVYRTDGVDLTGDATLGYKLGWTFADEWLEYTVTVSAAAAYKWEARVSAGVDGAAFRVWLDDVDITGLIEVANGGDWDSYSTLTGVTPQLTSGDHILKVAVEGSLGNLDWIRFVDQSTSIRAGLQVQSEKLKTYKVYSVSGILQGQFEMSPTGNVESELQKLVVKPGVYLVKDRLGTQVYRVKLR